jgi:hypothetical protein
VTCTCTGPYGVSAVSPTTFTFVTGLGFGATFFGAVFAFALFGAAFAFEVDDFVVVNFFLRGIGSLVGAGVPVAVGVRVTSGVGVPLVAVDPEPAPEPAPGAARVAVPGAPVCDFTPSSRTIPVMVLSAVNTMRLIRS